MANTIKLKRSSTTGDTPTTSQMELGEIAVNTFDGKLFIRGNNGSDFVNEISSITQGGGSNADTLDNLDSSQFLRSDANDTATGDINFTGAVTCSSGVTVTGLLSATTKSFVINHPTKDGLKLRYGSLEGPENGVYVRGRTKENIIMLPEYWKGLVDEESITVNITPIGRDQGIWVSEWDNEKVVLDGITIDCFYTIYGERKDVDKFEVEYK